MCERELMVDTSKKSEVLPLIKQSNLLSARLTRKNVTSSQY